MRLRSVGMGGQRDIDPSREERERTPTRLALGTGELERIRQDAQLAEIGHDLCAPVSVIALEVSLLEGKLPALSEDAALALSRIARNLAVLDHLLHDLIDLAAIDAGRLTIERNPVDLAALLVDVVDRLLAPRDSARVVVTLESSTAIVLGDGPRLERILHNLLNNALRLTIAAAPITLVLQVRGDIVHVAVEDAGAGFAPDAASRIFEPFRRGQLTGGGGAAGLGLYVGRKVIEAHHGRIGVHSTLGVGSRFYLELPLLRAPALDVRD